MLNRRWLAIAAAFAGMAALSACGDSRVGRLVGSQPAWISHFRPPRNLITNGSFERNGQPSLDGWRVTNPALTSVVREPPPWGGSFALRLEADWAPTTGYITTPIPGARDGGIFRLSAYGRAVDSNGGGAIALAVGKSYELAAHVKSAYTSETSWTRLSLEDTLTVPPGDTVWVVISSFHTEIARRVGLFDLVVLERKGTSGRTLPD